MVEYLALFQNPLFWRQLAVGVVILVVLLGIKLIYRTMKWTVLLVLLGIIIAAIYGRLFFVTYSTEGERAEVEERSKTTWQRVQELSRDWLRFE